MSWPTPEGSGGTIVKIAIPEFRGLLKGLEVAQTTITTADQGAHTNLERHLLPTDGLSGLHRIALWISDTMPELRRRLAKAEAIAQSTPGIPNLVTFSEESISSLTPGQARVAARRAAELMSYGGMPLQDELEELNLLLYLHRDDPYFAHEFALQSDPRAWAAYIRGLTPGESLPGYLAPEEYDDLLNGLSATIALASRGTAELDLGEQWRTKLAELMTLPRLEGTDTEQVRIDTENRPALWLLLSRGHYSTEFLKDLTSRLAHLDGKGHLWMPPGANFIAIAPNGRRFMDPMVALMGALVNNPEAAHWAFTQGGTTQVPFPKDGEKVTGPVQTFLHNLLTNHRFADEEFGAQTVLLALRAALTWKQDDSIVISAENLQKSMKQTQEVWDEKSWFAKWGHTTFDTLGMVPVFGELFDGVSTVWYALEGDWVNAGLSSASMVPFAGSAVGVGRLSKNAHNLADTLAIFDRFGNLIDDADLARKLSKGVQLAPGVYRFPNPKDLNAALWRKRPNLEFRSRDLSLTTNSAGKISELRVYVNGNWVRVDNSKLGLKLAGYRAGDSVWDLIGLTRGEAIESVLAVTTYRHMEHVGKRRRGFYPTIDFYDKATKAAVSLKTLDPPNPKNFRKIKKNLDRLADMNSSKVIPDGRPLKSSLLVLRVRIGQQNHPALDELRDYARNLNVNLKINTY